MRAGKFPDRAMIVFDLLNAKSSYSAVREGERKVGGVMVKQARKYEQTGRLGVRGIQRRYA